MILRERPDPARATQMLAVIAESGPCQSHLGWWRPNGRSAPLPYPFSPPTPSVVSSTELPDCPHELRLVTSRHDRKVPPCSSHQSLPRLLRGLSRRALPL